MTFENSAEITKEAVAQTMGATYMEKEGVISAIESGNLVEVLKDIQDMDKGYDIFCKSLIDVIGKYEFDMFSYEPEIKSIFKDSFEWGAFVERIKFSLNMIENDDLFNLVDGKDYSAYEHKVYAPKISVKGITKRKAITIPLTIKTSDIETAFTSLTEMTKFISAIREAREQTKKIILDTYAKILVGSAIAISDKVTKTSIHLLTEAKALGIVDENATAETFRHSTKANNYALMRMATVREYMKRHTVAYNNKANIPPSGTTNMFMLNEYEKNCRFTSEADTYHSEKLSVGEYDIVSMWQAFAENVGVEETATMTDYLFKTVSSVEINDSENLLGIGNTVRVENCVALITDYKAIGIYNEKDRITSSYTASADFWNEFERLTMNYVLDTDYSIVAFILD